MSSTLLTSHCETSPLNPVYSNMRPISFTLLTSHLDKLSLHPFLFPNNDLIFVIRLTSQSEIGPYICRTSFLFAAFLFFLFLLPSPHQLSTTFLILEFVSTYLSPFFILFFLFFFGLLLFLRLTTDVKCSKL